MIGLFGCILWVGVILGMPLLPGLVTSSWCIAHIANGCRVSTADDTKYDGSYGTPVAFVWRNAIGSWAFGGTMSYLATAEALVAA